MSVGPNRKEIENAICEKYKKVAYSAEGMFNYPTGIEGARALGYDPEIIASAPPQLLRSFCGVGNPFALGKLLEGESILDVGCGAGFDLYVASRKVGASGHVYGVDLTPEMVSVAIENIAHLGLKNVEVRQGASEALPYKQGSMDLVISNGVLNLSPRKEMSFQEIFRVLRRGGRLQFADIILDNDLPQGIVCGAESWSN